MTDQLSSDPTLDEADWGEERSRTVTWQDPLRSAEAGLEMAGIDYIHAMIAGRIPPPPISKLIQMDLTEAEPGRVVFTCTPDQSAMRRIMRTSARWSPPRQP